MRFENKTAMITGAAVGIGRACALQFAKEGANVIVLDYNPETLEHTEKELKEITPNVLAIVCDVSDYEAVNAAAEQGRNTFGKIDILINNAALWRIRSPFCETDIEIWKQFMDINVMGTVYCTKAVLPQMIENGYGRVINVASVAGVYGNAKMVHYSATKGAVISMTKALAKEVAELGVTINAVSPGSVSPAAEADIDYHKPSELSYMGRTGTGRENADLICFLASEQAGYINGQNIQIDGCRKKI